MKKLIILVGFLMILGGCAVVPDIFKENSTTENFSEVNFTNTSEENVTELVLDETNNTILETVENDNSLNESNLSDSENSINDDDEVDNRRIPTRTVNEGELVQFRKDIAFDPDGDELLYTFSSPLDKEGAWQTQIGDAGEYIVTITVSDGVLDSSTQARIVVLAVNKLPIISNITNISVNEGERLVLSPTVTDPDGDNITVTYSGFMNSNTKEIGFEDAGVYQVIINANDGKQKVNRTISVTVVNVNRPPVLSNVSDVTINEGEEITVSPVVSDPDGDEVRITFGRPLSSDGTWVTKIGDAGRYLVEIKASDGEDEVVRSININVVKVNSAPVLVMQESIQTSEGETLVLNPQVSDEDEDIVRITYSGFMNTSSRYIDFGEAGNYEVVVSATDGVEVVTKTVSIIVNATNRPPSFISEDLFE